MTDTSDEAFQRAEIVEGEWEKGYKAAQEQWRNACALAANQAGRQEERITTLSRQLAEALAERDEERSRRIEQVHNRDILLSQLHSRLAEAQADRDEKYRNLLKLFDEYGAMCSQLAEAQAERDFHKAMLTAAPASEREKLLTENLAEARAVIERMREAIATLSRQLAEAQQENKRAAEAERNRLRRTQEAERKLTEAQAVIERMRLEAKVVAAASSAVDCPAEVRDLATVIDALMNPNLPRDASRWTALAKDIVGDSPPTDEMIKAGASVICGMELSMGSPEHYAKEIYRAMSKARRKTK